MTISEPRLYWLGNAAKTRIIAEVTALASQVVQLTVFDYGCGDGGDWPRILADHGNIRLVAYEPYAPSYRHAKERLRGLAAEVYTGNSIETLSFKADVIVSFSVFEHIYAKRDFLGHAKRLLAKGGVFYLNYDDGHFRNLLDLSCRTTWWSALREWARTQMSRLAALFYRVSRYQRRVQAEETDLLVAEAGFSVERVDYANLQCLKALYKTLPEDFRQAYVAFWLRVEEELNKHYSACLTHPVLGDSVNLWQQMPSRTLVLRHF